MKLASCPVAPQSQVDLLPGPTPDAQLVQACTLSDVPGVRAALAAGADVHTRSGRGCTPLHLACTGKNEPKLEIAALLIAAGGRVNTANDDGVVPLHWAASYGHQAMAELLLRHGADLRLADHEGQTALLGAVFNSDTALVDLLLSKGASPQAARRDGGTPLHAAALLQKREMVLQFCPLVDEQFLGEVSLVCQAHGRDEMHALLQASLALKAVENFLMNHPASSPCIKSLHP